MGARRVRAQALERLAVGRVSATSVATRPLAAWLSLVPGVGVGLGVDEPGSISELEIGQQVDRCLSPGNRPQKTRRIREEVSSHAPTDLQDLLRAPADSPTVRVGEVPGAGLMRQLGNA